MISSQWSGILVGPVNIVPISSKGRQTFVCVYPQHRVSLEQRYFVKITVSYHWIINNIESRLQWKLAILIYWSHLEYHRVKLTVQEKFTSILAGLNFLTIRNFYRLSFSLPDHTVVQRFSAPNVKQTKCQHLGIKRVFVVIANKWRSAVDCYDTTNLLELLEHNTE